MRPQDIEDLARFIEEQPELAHRLRQALLTKELLELPQHVAALVGAMRDMAGTERAILEAAHSLSQGLTTVIEGMHTLMEGHQRLQQDVVTLKEGQARLERDVAVLKQDVATLKQDVAALKEGQARLERDVAVLKQDVATLKQDVAALKEGQVRLERDVAVLKEDVAALKEGQTRLERWMARLQDQVDELRGDSLERRYRERAPSYFAPLARRIRVIPREELAELLEDAQEEGAISEEEAAEAADADVVARGRRREDGEPVVIVAEVSATIFPSDVHRAVARAAAIGKALKATTIAAVAGQRLRPEAEAIARERLWRLLDGRHYPPGTAAPAVAET